MKLLLLASLMLLPSLVCADAVDGTLRIELKGALLFQDRPAKDQTVARDFQVDVTCREGKWLETIWGFSNFVPAQEHLGKLVEAKIDGDRLDLRVKVRVAHNRNEPMVVGGEADFTIQLRRDGDRWSGSFTGACRDANRADLITELEKAWGYGYVPGQGERSQTLIRNHANAFLATGEVKGAAAATVVKDPVAVTDFSRIKSGEHPRLLFHRDDVAHLRQRAATPQGQKIIAELNDLLDRAEKHGFAYFPPAAEHSMGNMWATGHALLYQLTGDRAHARRAADLCLANLYGSYYYGGWWIHAYTLTGIAFSYDMCYDAWDEPTRRLFYSYLEQNVRQLAGRADAADYLDTADRFAFANDQSKFRLHSPRDSYGNKFRAAAAIAALAILNDPPPTYRPPAMADVPTIKPAGDYEPWVGVPVEPFESDVMPRNWLINGPFLRGGVDKVFAAAGGLGTIRPEPGTLVQYEGESLDFRAYRPSGWDATHGGSIYARNCSRYWASATGGGYSPGIRLMRKWREAAGKNVGINVCLYTVIDNDRERIVQALPNWRSRSIGNRMWINGTPVVDGQLVRLTKGLYPLMVDVAVVGGYSGQSPKVREYSPENHARDLASHDRAVRAFSGTEPADNELLRNLVALTRSVRRFIPADIGNDGWSAWEAQETLLPFLLAYRTATGTDLSRDTPLGNLLPMAVRLRGHSMNREMDYAVSQSIALMPEAHSPVARWYLDRYGSGIHRPLDAVIALVTHPLDAKPQKPETLFARAGVFTGYDVHAFRSGWEGSGDILAILETGTSAYTSPFTAGNLTLHGLGRPWIHARSGEDYLRANNFSIRDFYPAQAPKLLHKEYAADGSGSLSFEIGRFSPGTVVGEKHSQIQVAGGDAGMSWRRAVLVDYSGASGAAALIVIADKISGAGFREKTWRFDLGEIREFGRGGDGVHGLHLAANSFLARPRQSARLPDLVDDASMRVAFVLNGNVEFIERTYGEGRRTIIEAKLERKAAAAEKAIKAGPGADPSVPRGDDLLDELDSGNKEVERKRLAPVTVFTIITLQEKLPPKLTTTGEGEGTVITVGKQVIRFDGTRLSRDN